MKKKVNYYVIGGQYRYYCYGGTPTLIGAKRLANRNQEYWDNWQGWHTPAIYSADDCEINDGVVYPKEYANPVCRTNRRLKYATPDDGPAAPGRNHTSNLMTRRRD